MTKKRIRSLSILRFWRTPPGPIKKEEEKGIERQKKVKPIELGILGIITWPIAIFRAILDSIKGQAEEEVKEEQEQEQDKHRR